MNDSEPSGDRRVLSFETTALWITDLSDESYRVLCHPAEVVNDVVVFVEQERLIQVAESRYFDDRDRLLPFSPNTWRRLTAIRDVLDAVAGLIGLPEGEDQALTNDTDFWKRAALVEDVVKRLAPQKTSTKG